MKNKDNEMNKGMNEEFSFDLTEDEMEVRRARRICTNERAARVCMSPLIGRAFALDVSPIRSGLGLHVLDRAEERAETAQLRSSA